MRHRARCGLTTMRPAVLVLVVCLLWGTASTSASSGCCSSYEPEGVFGGITAYELVNAPDIDAYSRETVEGCHPVYFWHAIRHGTRYLTSMEDTVLLNTTITNLQTRIQENLDNETETICIEDAKKIVKWRLEEEAFQQVGQLTEQGQDDMFVLGLRDRMRYPRLIGDHATLNSTQQYLWRATSANRTRQSAYWYAYGISDSGYELNLPESIEDDPLLQFYDDCPAWIEGVYYNATAMEEVYKFINGSYMNETLVRVSDKLGFSEILTFEEVEQMWVACAYDQAWDPSTPAVWCNVFEEEDLEVFEYLQDLKYYYQQGYGNEINLKLGCPLVKDLVDRFFDRVTNGPQPEAGVLYFLHDTALRFTLAHLGVANDSEALTADNYESMKNRTWKTSKLVPMAGNLAFVLYECPYEAGDGERFMVKPFLNEKPVTFDSCNSTDDSTLCSFLHFYEALSLSSMNCSLEWCGNFSSSTTSASTTTTTDSDSDAEGDGDAEEVDSDDDTTTDSSDSTTTDSSSSASFRCFSLWSLVLAVALAVVTFRNRQD